MRRLAVIVAARWPGSDVNSKGQVKSPKILLEVIVAEEAQVGRTGPVLVLDEPATSPVLPTVQIPHWPTPPPDPGVRVEVAVLRDALLATAPRRHGKLVDKSLEPNRNKP